MEKAEKKDPGFLSDASDIRKLIAENPSLPILCFADAEKADLLTGTYMLCDCKAVLGEVLNCTQNVNEEHIFLDRDDLEDSLRDVYEDFDGSEEEFDRFIESKMLEYEPFWTPCIVLFCRG